MSWIDVAILAAIVLCGLFGVWRGAKKSAVTLGAFIIAFLLAFFLANVVAEAMLGIDGIKNFVLGNGFEKSSSWSLAKWLYDEMPEGFTTNKFLAENFFAPILKIMNEAKVDLPASQGMALYGAFMIFSAICGVGIFLVARFLLVIVVVIINTYIDKKKSLMVRLFGFAVGAVRGLCWSFAALVVFSCFGGYTCFSGIDNMQKEFENNAVVCQYFYKGAFGMKNGVLLPDADTYGRLVNMVFKKKEEPIFKEPLAGDRLELFINLSNLNYENSPWSIDETKTRKFDEQNAIARNYTDFQDIEFDNVIKAILDYNASAAGIVTDTSKLLEINSDEFREFNSFVKTGSNSVDSYMKTLWAQLVRYQRDRVPQLANGETLSSKNSTLKTDYDNIVGTIDAIKEKYEPMTAAFGAFPELTMPDQIVLTEEDIDSYVPPVPENPDPPETPDTPDPGPSEPENPDPVDPTPETPDEPDTPTTPEEPDEPSIPSGGEESEPETPTDPGESGNDNTDDVPPDTGDDTGEPDTGSQTELI